MPSTTTSTEIVGGSSCRSETAIGEPEHGMELLEEDEKMQEEVVEDDNDNDDCDINDDPEEEAEKDPFWSIALQSPPNDIGRDAVTYHGRRYIGDGTGDDDKDCPNHQHSSSSSAFEKYTLPTTRSSSSPSVTLELAPVPIEDGIWGPLGGDAWYASALLATMIGMEEEGSNSSYNILQQQQFRRKDSSSFNVLELGSGAMGLPGFACAVTLEKIRRRQQQQQHLQEESQSTPTSTTNSFTTWNVYFTDNDSDVLRQLDRNVQHNQSTIFHPNDHYYDDRTQQKTREDTVVIQPQGHNEEQSQPDAPSPRPAPPHPRPTMTVRYLDWGSDLEESTTQNDDRQPVVHSCDDNNDDARGTTTSLQTPQRCWMDDIDVVVGSELVYTEQTAYALVNILFELLTRNPCIKIWIVQVTDRFGWTEIVLPT